MTSKKTPSEEDSTSTTDVEVRKPRTRPTYDWGPIRTEYIEGIPRDGSDLDREYPTLQDIAEKYGIHPQTVRGRAASEHWTEQKNAFSMKVTQKRQQARAKELAKNAAGFDEKSYKAAELGVNLIMTRLAEIGQEVARRKPIRDRAMERLASGQALERKEDLYSGVNYREMEGLAGALDRFQNIGMRALGTDARKVEITGPDGEPLDLTSTTINVTQEITRDDPERVAMILSAMKEAGQIPPEAFEDILDVEVVEDEDDEDQEEGDFEDEV